MWQEEEGQLVRVFRFDNFLDAFAFMTKVAMTAEKMKYYPEWTNKFNLVTVRLGDQVSEEPISDQDHFLAAAIDNLYGD